MCSFSLFEYTKRKKKHLVIYILHSENLYTFQNAKYCVKIIIKQHICQTCEKVLRLNMVDVSVPCNLAIASWETVALLALLCVMFSCIFVTFSCDVFGQVWYLNVSIPDLCLLLYFKNIYLVPFQK